MYHFKIIKRKVGGPHPAPCLGGSQWCLRDHAVLGMELRPPRMQSMTAPFKSHFIQHQKHFLYKINSNTSKTALVVVFNGLKVKRLVNGLILLKLMK